MLSLPGVGVINLTRKRIMTIMQQQNENVIIFLYFVLQWIYRQIC